MTTDLKSYVIDASVAVKWLLPEELTDKADLLLRRYETDETMRWLAPEFVYLEIANALWKRVKLGGLELRDAMKIYEDFRMESLLAIKGSAWLVETSGGYKSAFEIAKDLNHNAIYDCCYLALAIRSASILITADKVFVERASKAGYQNHVLFLADYN